MLEDVQKMGGVEKIGDQYYNFWRDKQNPAGLWRRTTLAEYRKAAQAAPNNATYKISLQRAMQATRGNPFIPIKNSSYVKNFVILNAVKDLSAAVHWERSFTLFRMTTGR